MDQTWRSIHFLLLLLIKIYNHSIIWFFVFVYLLKKKLKLDDETQFCSIEILKDVLKCKVIIE